jgi:small subunit ribosomal protein S4
MRVRFNGAKVKLSRKLGVALTAKAAKYMERRPYGPGVHASGGRQRRLSDYGAQLLEKQKLRFQYNVHERQMRNYYKSASQMKGRTGDNLVRLLETRLDSMVLRAGLAPSIFAARQVVGHGHIRVNGKKVDIPSYRVKVNDEISVRPKSRELQNFDLDFESYQLPSYMERGETNFEAKLTSYPVREEVPVICDVQYVVEYYNR